MAINIEPEPDELTGGNVDDAETCVFCGNPTIYWHKESNRPVCSLCSVINEPQDITSAPYYY